MASNFSAVGNATEQQWLPSVSIDTIGDLGPFDTASGGDPTANVTKSRPGGMGPEITYLGLITYGNATVGRTYVIERDQSTIARLIPLVGRVYANLTIQPLDADGNPINTPRTYRGRLTDVNTGNADGNSNTARKWSLQIAVETVAN